MLIAQFGLEELNVSANLSFVACQGIAVEMLQTLVDITGKNE